MKKFLRTLVIIILLGCAFLLIKKNTTRFSASISTGSVVSNTVFESNKFFAVGGFFFDDAGKISIYDKADVSKPYKVISLPTPTEGSGRYVIETNMQQQSPVFFETTGMYVLGNFIDNNDGEESLAEKNSILFYITIDGEVSKVATIKNLAPSMPDTAIDQTNQKIYRLNAIENTPSRCSMAMYDIKNNSYTYITKDNLSSGQKLACEKSEEGLSFLSVKEGVLKVIFDLIGVDSITPKAKVLTIDMLQGKVTSEVPYAQYERNSPSRISFSGDCILMDPSVCTVLIDNKIVLTPKDIYLKTFVNDNTMFAMTSTGYTFVTLESLQPIPTK